MIRIAIILTIIIVSFGGCQTSDNPKPISHSIDGKIPIASRGVNLDALRYYFNEYNSRGDGWGRFNTEASNSPRKIETNLQTEEYVKKQLETTSLLSYKITHF